MGFSIGKFIGAVAPVVGAVLGGPTGFALGSAVSAGFAPDPAPPPGPVPGRAVTPQFAAPPPVLRASQTAPSPIQRFNGFPVGRRRVGTIGGLAAGAVVGTAVDLFGGFFGGGQERIADILQQARQTFGRGVTRNKIIAAAKACGIDLAAQTFGLSTEQVCKVIVAGGARRRRGISAADIRRTKRTLRFVKGLRRDLKAIKA